MSSASPATSVLPEQDVRTSPLWHVVLLNDDDHTYDYVIEMLGKIFGLSRERAFICAVAVDREGRVVVDTTSRERAELKCEQIHNFGPDARIPRCKGSMSAEIEPSG